MKVVLNSIFIPSSEGVPPPENFEKITSKRCILKERILRF